MSMFLHTRNQTEKDKFLQLNSEWILWSREQTTSKSRILKETGNQYIVVAFFNKMESIKNNFPWTKLSALKSGDKKQKLAEKI